MYRGAAEVPKCAIGYCDVLATLDDYGRVDDAGFPVAANGALYLNPADLSASQARWRYAGAVVTLINRDCDSTCEGIAKTD